MKLIGDTILITGGSEGIGLALARALEPNNTVIICSRNQRKLEYAKNLCNGLHTEVCDVSDTAQRQALVKRLVEFFPHLNVVINNAGAKRTTDLAGPEDLNAAKTHDMSLNFSAPAELCIEFLPHLRSQANACIVNMTTGLVYLPKAKQAFYCAAKSALHSFTLSLAWALKESSVEVCEVSLPLVDTQFHQSELPKNMQAMKSEEAANKTLRGIRKGKKHVYIGKTLLAHCLSLIAPDTGMAIVNR